MLEARDPFLVLRIADDWRRALSGGTGNGDDAEDVVLDFLASEGIYCRVYPVSIELTLALDFRPIIVIN